MRVGLWGEGRAGEAYGGAPGGFWITPPTQTHKLPQAQNPGPQTQNPKLKTLNAGEVCKGPRRFGCRRPMRGADKDLRIPLRAPGKGQSVPSLRLCVL